MLGVLSNIKLEANNMSPHAHVYVTTYDCIFHTVKPRELCKDNFAMLLRMFQFKPIKVQKLKAVP